jgi:hypothetical protein
MMDVSEWSAFLESLIVGGSTGVANPGPAAGHGPASDSSTPGMESGPERPIEADLGDGWRYRDGDGGGSS